MWVSITSALTNVRRQRHHRHDQGPTFDLVDTVIAVGNSHGNEVDKFEQFGLTAEKAAKVGAPGIAERYANFECKLIDSSLISRYSLFVFEVVKARVATSPRYPTTVHYRGEGIFMLSGRNVRYRKRFKPENL